MKTKAFIFVVLFLAGITIQAQPLSNEQAFKTGERCSYDLYYNWGFIWINAAKADFSVAEAIVGNAPAYKLQVTGSTVKAFSFYTFKDTAISYMDKKTMLPYYSLQASHESDYYAIDKYTFYNSNPAKWKVTLDRRTKRSTSSQIFTGEKHYFDILTLFYRLRNIDASVLAVNEKMPAPLVFNDGIYDLYLRYAGKDKIKLKNGKTYNCLKFKPSLLDCRAFDTGEGMTMWFTDDKNHLLLMVESKIKFGSVKAMLNTVENTAYPITSEVKK